MARIYADEDFDFNVTIEIRKFGHDVLTVQEAGRQGFGDPTVLSDATNDRRIVVTFNRDDFHRLARATFSHCGIITCTRDDDIVALAQRIDAAIQANPDLTNKLIRITKPHKP